MAISLTQDETSLTGFRAAKGSTNPAGEKVGGQFTKYDPKMTQLGGSGSMLLTLQAVNEKVTDIAAWGETAVLDTIASGIGSLVEGQEAIISGMELAARDAALAAANVQEDKGEGEKPVDLSTKFGNMLDSMEDAFANLSGTQKSMLGIAALVAGLALLAKYADEIIEALAPILRFFNEDFIPALGELNQIILDTPGGYLTLLSGIGLSTMLWNYFGVGGKLSKLFNSVITGLKGFKLSTLIDDVAIRSKAWIAGIKGAWRGTGGPPGTAKAGLLGKIGGAFRGVSSSIRMAFFDDIDFRTKAGKTWAGRINRALYGTKSAPGGVFGRISGAFRSIGTAIRESTLLTKLTSRLAALRTSAGGIAARIFGTAGGPHGTGQAGVLGRVRNAIRLISTTIRESTLLGQVGTKMATMGASWKASITAAMWGAKGAAGGGAIGSLTNAISRIAITIKGIFSPASLLGKFTGKIRGIFRIIAKALGFVSKMTGLTHFLKLGLSLGRAIPIVGQIIMVLMGIFSFIKGAIEGFKTGGILGAIKGGLIGLYDGLVGSFLNLIADLIGWIFKKLGFTRVGEFFSNMDFSFDSIMNGILWVIDKIQFLFHSYVNGLKHMANVLIKAANFLLPKRWEIEEFVIEPYESKKREPIVTESEAFDVGDVPGQGEQTRAEIEEVDVKALAAETRAKMEEQEIVVEEPFKDVETLDTTKTDAAAEAMRKEIEFEESEAGQKLKEAEEAKQEAIDNALVDESMRAIELETEEAMQKEEHAAVTVVDSSSRTQVNQHQSISNALSVDASDLVAARLNFVIPGISHAH